MKPPQAQIRLNRVKFAKDCARPKRFGSRAPSEFLTRDDSQRRFFLISVAMLEQCCNHMKQCRNNVEMTCCAKNRRCEPSRVTSP